MKKLTIKLKITLWFTLFMILLSAAIFAFISLVSSSSAAQNTRGALVSLIDYNMREIEYDDGQLDIDDDYVSFRNGIYSLVFTENGVKVSGYAPYAELEGEPFESGVIRSADIGGEIYLIYDRLVSFSRHDDIWVRGVVSESGGAALSSAVYNAVLIALPVLIILASAGGYMIAGRSLHPIQKIRKTAEEIGKSGDLSKRIEIDGSSDELYMLAETFNKMYERLEANFNAERSFTSDASHELRTPVTIILAQCEYAFENASGEDELYDAIGAVQKQGYRMTRLIESLLQFTRIEQQTDKVAFETVDLSGLAASVCAEQERIGEKDIVLTKDIQPGIEMQGDATLMMRMIGNLIGNAYKYGRNGGSITAGLKKTENKIVFSVTDDGIGITSEELPKIWNRFYRVDKSRSSAAVSGHGLGLAFVKQIAELHGGRVRAVSEFGKGSVFTAEFPVNTANKTSV